MCVLERPDDQSVLLVVHKIAPQVIKHDCVVFVVELWEFAPQEGQRLAVEHACTECQRLEILTPKVCYPHNYSYSIIAELMH